MHLRNYPQYFVKDGERIAVYYTADARDLRALGWEPEQSAKQELKPAPKVELAQSEVEVEVEKLEVELIEENQVESEKPEFEFMTRVELLAYAEKRGVDLPNNALKADLVEACKKL